MAGKMQFEKYVKTQLLAVLQSRGGIGLDKKSTYELAKEMADKKGLVLLGNVLKKTAKDWDSHTTGTSKHRLYLALKNATMAKAYDLGLNGFEDCCLTQVVDLVDSQIKDKHTAATVIGDAALNGIYAYEKIG